jgi:hypothetical protein
MKVLGAGRAQRERRKLIEGERKKNLCFPINRRKKKPGDKRPTTFIFPEKNDN